MHENEEPAAHGPDREKQVEEGIKAMRNAGQRLRRDMAKAPRKDRPRRYADSAINDAESAMEGHLAGARDRMKRIGVAKDASLGERLDSAKRDCEETITQARDDAVERWPTPMD